MKILKYISEYVDIRQICKSCNCSAAGIPLVDDDQTITLASGSVKRHFGNLEDLWHEQASSLHTLQQFNLVKMISWCGKREIRFDSAEETFPGRRQARLQRLLHHDVARELRHREPGLLQEWRRARILLPIHVKKRYKLLIRKPDVRHHFINQL